MTKKTYDTPNLQLIALRAHDIITDSQYDPESLDPEKPNNIFDETVVVAW